MFKSFRIAFLADAGVTASKVGNPKDSTLLPGSLDDDDGPPLPLRALPLPPLLMVNDG